MKLKAIIELKNEQLAMNEKMYRQLQLREARRELEQDMVSSR